MAGRRCFIVGDIHGCLDELNCLLDTLAPGSEDTIVFLGDYIDRGPASLGVIDRLLRLRSEGPHCAFLRGNHEDMFLSYVGWGGRYGESFLYNGGDATLRSYGLEHRPSHEIADRFPADHAEFLRALEIRHEVGSFLCVHAGLNPDRPLGAQDEEEMLWIRGAFIKRPHSFPFTVVFGHTPFREVLLDPPYKIGLDTGLVYGNKLSCLEIFAADLFQLRRGEAKVSRRSLRHQLEAKAG